MKLNAGGLSTLVIGRAKESATLKTYIQMSQHVAIIAPRRYGKTTLVNHVLDDLADEYLIARVDVFGASSVREFCGLIIDAVYDSIGITGFLKGAKENIVDFMSRFKLETADVKIGFDLLKETDENRLIQEALALPERFAQKHNKRAILFFDEFGDLNKFGEDFIKKMRSYFQTHGSVSYIFAGSQNSVMSNIFLNRNNAFFNFASLMQIGALEHIEVENTLCGMTMEIAGAAPITVTREVAQEIIAFSKLHPFYTIKLTQETIIDIMLNGSNTHNVAHAADKILQDNFAYFQSEWFTINAKKHKGTIFKELCGVEREKSLSENPSPSYKSQIIKELMDDSIIDSAKLPTDPLFALWIRSFT